MLMMVFKLLTSGHTPTAGPSWNSYVTYFRCSREWGFFGFQSPPKIPPPPPPCRDRLNIALNWDLSHYHITFNTIPLFLFHFFHSCQDFSSSTVCLVFSAAAVFSPGQSTLCAHSRLSYIIRCSIMSSFDNFRMPTWIPTNYQCKTLSGVILLLFYLLISLNSSWAIWQFQFSNRCRLPLDMYTTARHVAPSMSVMNKCK